MVALLLSVGSTTLFVPAAVLPLQSQQILKHKLSTISSYARTTLDNCSNLPAHKANFTTNVYVPAVVYPNTALIDLDGIVILQYASVSLFPEMIFIYI